MYERVSVLFVSYYAKNKTKQKTFADPVLNDAI